MSTNTTLLKPILLFSFLSMQLIVSAQSGVQTQQGGNPRTGGGPRELAARLLKKNLRPTGLSQAELNGYLVTDAYNDQKSGSLFVYLQQAYQGIPVYNKIGVYVFRNDTLVSKTPNFIPIARQAEGLPTTPAVDGVRAIHAAAGHLSITLMQEPRLLSKDVSGKHFVFSPGGISKRNIPSDLVWVSLKDGMVRLAWNVRISNPDNDEDWLVRVDAQNGAVLEKSSLVVSEKNQHDCMEVEEMRASTVIRAAEVGSKGAAFFGTPSVTGGSYFVYPFPLESANYGSRSADLDPWLRAGSGNNAVTLGWHYDNTNNYNYTRGNNVWAQQDYAGDDLTNGFADTSLTAIPSLSFNRTIDPSKSPLDYSNSRGGIDNLFYWNNLMHDISYQYGFDEAAGNFQASNQGRGGVEGDYVDAFAQHGGGINNANFTTPPDGENPVMRMFQWNYGLNYSFLVNTPAGIAGQYYDPNTFVEGGLSYNSKLVARGPITADVVYVNDAVGGLHQACGSISNASSLPGKIALIDRGGSSCPFTLKVKNCQNAGAIAVIVANNVSGVPVTMAPPTTGPDTTIVIPAVMISQTNGNTLKANLTGLNATLSATGVLRDGALDNAVMAHEYTHGISNRLTGGPANPDCLANAEQMGEGWSDYLALMVTTDWSTATATDGANSRPLGTYVVNELPTQGGIRHYPYSTNLATDPLTYSDVASTGGEVHYIGEIWCAAIWDMTWNIIQQEGIDADIYHGVKGNNIALQLVITGMKLQPCSPGFLDGRDAILKADSLLYGYRHKCAIWQAFARRGMGKSATQGSSNNFSDQTAATDLPTGVGISVTSDKALIGQGDNVTYTVKATCDCQAKTGVSVVNTLSSQVTYVSSSSGGVYSAPDVTWSGVDFAAGETKTFTVLASVTGSYQTPTTLLNDTRDPAGYASWTQPISTGSTSFTDVTTRSHSASHSWYAADRSTITDFQLSSGDITLGATASTLSFWHYYETDPAYDGGVVEISSNSGSTWQDLGAYMTQNGYNSSIAAEYGNALANRQAFSGSSGGQFINTSIDLSGWAGKTVRFRFRFGSDNSVSSDGWYIDDILLTSENGAANIGKAFSGATLLSSQSLTTKFAAAPLPVDFISFDARKQNLTTALHWTVNEEINVNKYIVERSGDGSSYSAIGTLQATGASDYSFVDGAPLMGRNFYRIREQDLDGKSALSVIKVLQFSNKALDVRVWPVPTYTGSVQLEVEADNVSAISAVLQNAVGQTIKVYTLKQGVNTLSLDNVVNGVYFLKVQTNKNDVEIRRIVVQ